MTSSLELPALIAAIPTGVAMLAKAVLWGKQVAAPSHNGNGNGNGSAEARGWMKAWMENQTIVLRGMTDTMQEIRTSLNEQRREHEAHSVQEMEAWRQQTMISEKMLTKLEQINGRDK